MTNSEVIPANLLLRKAGVYVRQSSPFPSVTSGTARPGLVSTLTCVCKK